MLKYFQRKKGFCSSYAVAHTAPQQSTFPSCSPAMQILVIHLSLRSTEITQQSICALLLQGDRKSTLKKICGKYVV